MKTTTLAYKTRWTDLSWDELVRYHSIERNYTAPEDSKRAFSLMERVQEFEIVSNVSVLGLGVSPLDKEDSRLDELVRWLESETTKSGSCVWMRRKGQSEVLVMDKRSFVELVHESTRWMEKKEGLLKLPEKFVTIDGETFALPSFIGNDERSVRYGQYGTMQIYMMGMMNVMEKLDQSNNAELLKLLKVYKNSFLASLLLPTVKEEQKIDDANDKRGFTFVTQRRVFPYSSSSHERIAEKMDQAPAWLFSILWQLVQSSLAYYHGRFPDLISKGGTSGKNTDMYVAKLGTDNAVMKYAGYPNVEAVNQEPVGVILERLDAMAKESKEWKKVKRKK